MSGYSEAIEDLATDIQLAIQRFYDTQDKFELHGIHISVHGGRSSVQINEYGFSANPNLLRRINEMRDRMIIRECRE